MTSRPYTRTPTEFIAFIEELADASRKFILSRFRLGTDITMKSDDTPVTATDLEVESLLRQMIGDRYPSHGIVGEEHPDRPGSSDHVWVIDPIDGTRSFIAGRPVFGTLIALTVDGVPVLGVVDIPVTRERWLGATGHDTLLNGVKVSPRQCSRLSDAILLTSSPEYLTGDANARFHDVADAAKFTIYDAGTQGYGLLASGYADVLITARYAVTDYLAAVPVIEGAGGAIRDWAGNPLTLRSGDRLAAVGDAKLLPAVLERLCPGSAQNQRV